MQNKNCHQYKFKCSILFFRYFDRRDFEYVEMDTDSAYMALSGPLETLVKLDKKTEFYEEYEQWFPRPFCPQHKQEFLNRNVWSKKHEERACCAATRRHDCRTPGLFKTEFAGDGIVALNSKTYCCWRESDNAFKYSSKGLSKSTNSLNKESFLDVLYNRESMTGTNKGFRLCNNQMYTYTQKRKALSWQYAKRQLLADGVSTRNIRL